MSYPEMNYSLGGAARSREQQHNAYVDMRNQQAALNAAFNSTASQRVKPPIALPNQNHWSVVLGVKTSATVAEIKTAYRRLAKAAHSDAGGNDIAMSRLNVARDEALKGRKP